MIEWFVAALRHHAELALFLTLGIGYLLGKLYFGGFSLGAVTGTLLAGVLVGQRRVTVFPFSIGYRCGPQFFQDLRKDGLAQAAIAAIVAATGLVVAYVVARAFSNDPGTAGGVIAGSLTESATIGTTGDAISGLEIGDAARAAMANKIPVAFAVTYLIGVVGAGPAVRRVGSAGERALGSWIAERVPRHWLAPRAPFQDPFEHATGPGRRSGGVACRLPTMLLHGS